MKTLLRLLCLFCFNLPLQIQAYWTDLGAVLPRNSAASRIPVSKARYIAIDQSALRSALTSVNGAPVFFTLPLPDGGTTSFWVSPSEVMHPDLAARYPQIRTWSGKGISDRTATVYLDQTPQGFHAMILSESGQIFIDPQSEGDAIFHQVYHRSALLPKAMPSLCSFNPNDEENLRSATQTAYDRSRNNLPVGVQRSAGSDLRTYRLALACTGEYSTFHGGTVPLVLAAMVTSVNRVNGVYERELSVRFTLIPNTDTLIFLNAATDPYSNNNGGTMLGQNQSTITSYIGSANYDFGHVFSTGGGGIAFLGCICNSGNKSRGVTGLNSPVGDAFDIDYVAHEMGHQFGANHTFNGTTGGCQGNGNPGTAFEPGSGTTIMAYAGICSPQNIQNNSDPYFHTASFDEIQDYITFSTGSICPVISVSGNTPPVIVSTGPQSLAIPYQTPFVLTGEGYDPDGDTITWCWEEYDLGPAGSPSTPSGQAPLFRSPVPVLSPSRYFPKLSAIIANSISQGERLPTYARTLTFRLTARDNRNGGGGVTYEDVPVVLDVINTGAPFLVTQPNTAVTWPALSQQFVTWDVVGTDQAPINATTVDVLLSLDGGLTWKDTLAASVPNTGSAQVVVPDTLTSTARIIVKASGNVFFDMSNTNFTISAPQSLLESQSRELTSVWPNPGTGKYQYTIPEANNKAVNWEIIDYSGRVLKSGRDRLFSGNTGSLDLTGFTTGTYLLHITLADSVYFMRIIHLGTEGIGE